MGLLLNLLTLPASGPIILATWLGKSIVREAQQEREQEEARLKGALLELQLRYDLGELAPEEFAAQERGLLERLEALRQI